MEHARFGPTLRAWRENGAIPRKAKALACAGMALGFVMFFAFVHPGLILALGVGAVRNGTGPDLPNTASVWFPGHDALDLQRALGEEGLSVTAQASRAASEPGADLAVVAPSVPRPSHVLRAMGCDDARATQSLRFSLGSTTRAAEVEGAIDILERVLKGTRIEPSA